MSLDAHSFVHQETTKLRQALDRLGRDPYPGLLSDVAGAVLKSLEGGGLSASMVDLVPFALMRALSQASLVQDLEPTAEAIVCVGASITNVVVHQRGVPEFVRMLDFPKSTRAFDAAFSE